MSKCIGCSTENRASYPFKCKTCSLINEAPKELKKINKKEKEIEAIVKNVSKLDLFKEPEE